MKRIWFGICCLIFAATAAYAWQGRGAVVGTGAKQEGLTLPDGKQRDDILKDEYKKSLQDAAQLVKLSEELRDALEAGDPHVVSLKAIKQTEEIEKLAKNIRGRLKR
jgi:hypothetical protein